MTSPCLSTVPWTTNYFGTLAGTGGTQLHVTPAQHRSESPTMTRRRLNNLGLRLYYSGNVSSYCGSRDDPAPCASGTAAVTPALAAPFPMAEIRYQISMGVEDGVAVWSDPEVIGLSPETGQVYWGQNVGEVNERVVVWANTVSEMLEDELMNGVDDNGNQLVNELGLAFSLDDRSVTIRLSLEREAEEGKNIQVTRETTVTCRN